MAFNVVQRGLITMAMIGTGTMPVMGGEQGIERRLWFNRCCAHYGAIDDAFGEYLAEVRPQVAICGNFGPNYWAAASSAREKGETALWTALGGGPVVRQWWKEFIGRAHQRDIRVLGMFALTCTYGDPKGPHGFFRFFDREWDEALLGPRPPGRAVDLMQRRLDGSLWEERVYRIEGGAEYWGCPSNPAWRAALKGMVSAALGLEIDGFISVFPQRHDCTCEHCQEGFRRWLESRYTAEELAARFQITDLPRHRFTTLNGWFEAQQSSPYALECLKYTQAVLKDCFDEVFVAHGRGIRPDLILGQWNHIYRSSYQGPGQLAGTFAQLNADERCVLDSTRWAGGEDFVWYSIGNWSMYDEPAQRSFGDFLLERKYLYEAGDGRPAGVKSDDPVRVRLLIAEAAAAGGFAYTRGPDYRDPATMPVVKTYFDFLRRHEPLYRPAASYAEAALVWGRRAVHRGDISAIPDFKRLGRLLLKNHVLFDVLLDENVSLERLAGYRLVLVPDARDLSADQRQDLATFNRGGGRVVGLARPGDAGREIIGMTRLSAQELDGLVPVAYQEFRPFLDEWLPGRSDLSSAPDTVSWTCFQESGLAVRKGDERTSISRRLVVHLVNYLRDRRPMDGLRGAALERPLQQGPITVHLRIPPAVRVNSVRLMSPDERATRKLKFELEEARVSFLVPSILVYAVVVVETGK
ncbi:MAG: hypothetical protein HYU36_15190 [Planctomycetes bacterium]|nr:hypothetical protein [Planctomycetota bacterium]